jgi:hypothetical protein
MLRAAIAFSLLVCTSAFGADDPKWLKDARARESKSLKTTEIRSKDGWFRARVPGKVKGAIEKVEGSYSVELNISSDASVFCEVFPEGVDFANALRVTFDNSLKTIESSQGKLEARALERTDAGAFGTVPFISATWLYRVSGPDGALVGALKQIIMEKDETAVYCAHNELGYAQTFATLAQAFAESLVTQAPVVTPHFLEISTASMSGTKIGVTVSRLERDSDGDTRALQSTAIFLATADGKIQSQDSRHLNWVRPDGSLINSVSTDVANGEVTESLGLKQADDGTWSVEGTVQGKNVKTSLPAGSQPGNWVLQSQQLRALLAEPDPVGREHSMGLWIAENPEKLTAVKTRILAKHGDAHFTARGDIGAIPADLTIDKATGTAAAADVQIGPVKMKLERVHVSGSF